MEIRDIAAGRLSVSRIGLGLAALGRPGYINLGHGDDLERRYDIDAMQLRSWSVLDAAREMGIRYVDVARSYGRAEEFLSGWLSDRRIRPDEVTVGSKWGYTYTAGWSVGAPVHELKDHSLATLERQQAESRALLGRWLHLYQIHSATESSGVLDRPNVLDRLAMLRAEHGIAIGLTMSGPDAIRTLERAMDTRRDGRPLFDAVQATWNILNPALGAGLSAANADGIGIIIKEALANGRLTARNNDPSFAERRTELERQAERIGCSIDQLALAAVLDEPWADCALSGATTIDQLVSNVGALTISLDDEARAALAGMAESVKDYWRKRSELPWN